MKKSRYIITGCVWVLATLASCDTNSQKDVVTEHHKTASHSHNKNSKSENACKLPLTQEDSIANYRGVLTIKGDVEFPLSITVDSLKKMNVVELDSFKVVCQTGATMSQNVSSRGVLLKDILQKAKIIQHNHKDRNFYIVARASDGYMATFSWGEIFNSNTGENTYVIFEENNAPIRKGAFVLNTLSDIKTGPRHVYWLNSIEVNRVN